MPLKEAAEYLGVTDTTRLLNKARKFGCARNTAGVYIINLDAFLESAAAEMIENNSAKAGRSPRQVGIGSSIGILSARIKRAPELITNKEKAIKVAEATITAAQNPYEKRKAKLKFQVLKAGLENLRINQAADQAARDKIINDEATDEAEVDKIPNEEPTAPAALETVIIDTDAD